MYRHENNFIETKIDCSIIFPEIIEKSWCNVDVDAI
jgi:hypothetical protein